MQQNFIDNNNNSQWKVALALTILIHIIIVLSIPEKKLFSETLNENAINQKNKEDFDLVYEEPAEENPWRFVETNPEVATNEPDPTFNFAARSQQGAQEDPVPIEKNTHIPEVKGLHEHSQKIVQTEHSTVIGDEPQSGIVMVKNESADNSQILVEEEKLSQPFTPIKSMVPEELQKESPITDPGKGIDIAPVKINQQESNNNVVALNPTNVENKENNQNTKSASMPKARPRIGKRIVDAPLMKSEGGVSRQGRLAIDAKFSEFGEYTQRILEAISYNLNQFGSRLDLSRDHGSSVVVSFKIDFEGTIKNVEVISATSSETTCTLSKDSILCLNPFDSWSEEMKSVLGKEQSIRITFNF